MDPATERYYRVLELEPTASPDEVYRAYRNLVRIWDPQRFATQPQLELMAEAKLKEIIEAYNALTSKTDVIAAPAPADRPQILTPVPDHLVDRNAPQPVFAPGASVAPEPGQPPEETPVPMPLRPWEQARPASYPKPEPPATPAIHFAPPPPPAANPISRLAAQFGVFLIPVLLVAVGLYLYDSAPSRSDRQDQALSKPGSPGQAKNQSARAGNAAAAKHAPKKAAEPVAEQAEAAPISLPNGAQLMPPLGPRGAGRFRIANRSGQDAVVRVTLQAAPGTPLRMVYVQEGTEVPIEGIGTGVYMVGISLGPLTKAPRRFAPPLGPFQFMQIESVEGPQSDDYQLVLKPTQ